MVQVQGLAPPPRFASPPVPSPSKPKSLWEEQQQLLALFEDTLEGLARQAGGRLRCLSLAANHIGHRGALALGVALASCDTLASINLSFSRMDPPRKGVSSSFTHSALGQLAAGMHGPASLLGFLDSQLHGPLPSSPWRCPHMPLLYLDLSCCPITSGQLVASLPALLQVGFGV